MGTYFSNINELVPESVTVGYNIECFSSDVVIDPRDALNQLIPTRCRVANQSTGEFYELNVIGSFDKEKKSFIATIPNDVASGRYAITAIFSTQNNMYKFTSEGAMLTVEGRPDPQERVTLQSIMPRTVLAKDATNLFYTIRGTNLQNAKNFKLSKVSGLGPALIPLNISEIIPTSAKFRMLASATIIKEGRYRITVFDKNTGDLITCPIQLTINDND